MTDDRIESIDKLIRDYKDELFLLRLKGRHHDAESIKQRLGYLEYVSKTYPRNNT